MLLLFHLQIKSGVKYENNIQQFYQYVNDPHKKMLIKTELLAVYPWNDQKAYVFSTKISIGYKNQLGVSLSNA